MAERSDGSIVFLFGDPSEAMKEDELKQSHLSNEKVESEGQEESRVVKILDGDHEGEVIVKNIEREVESNNSNVVADTVNSVVVSTNEESSTGRFFEGPSETNEKFTEDPKDVEVPVSGLSTKDVGNISSSKLDAKNLTYADDSLSTVSVLEKNSQLENGDTSGGLPDGQEDNEVVQQLVSVEPDLPTEATDTVFQESDPESVEILDLSKDSEVHITESSMANIIIDDSNEINAIEILPVSPQTEAEPILDEEAGYIAIETFGEEHGSTQFSEVSFIHFWLVIIYH